MKLVIKTSALEKDTRIKVILKADQLHSGHKLLSKVEQSKKRYIRCKNKFLY